MHSLKNSTRFKDRAYQALPRLSRYPRNCQVWILTCKISRTLSFHQTNKTNTHNFSNFSSFRLLWSLSSRSTRTWISKQKWVSIQICLYHKTQFRCLRNRWRFQVHLELIPLTCPGMCLSSTTPSLARSLTATPKVISHNRPTRLPIPTAQTSR